MSYKHEHSKITVTKKSVSVVIKCKTSDGFQRNTIFSQFECAPENLNPSILCNLVNFELL